MGIQKTKLNNLSPETRKSVLEALTKPSQFRSNEMDFVPWIILAFVTAAAGLAGALFSVSWDMVENSIKHGESWDSIAINNPELPGMAGAAIVLAWCILYYIIIHMRCGQIIIAGAVVKIRGSKISMIDIADVKGCSTSQFKYGSETVNNRRTGSALYVKLSDGSTFKIISDSGAWTSRIREHIESGGKLL